MENQKNEKIVIQAWVDAKTHKQIKAIADSQERTIAWLIRRIINRIIKNGLKEIEVS